jgi:hypothetical protein
VGHGFCSPVHTVPQPGQLIAHFVFVSIPVHPRGISTVLNAMQSGTAHPDGTVHPGPVVFVTTGHETEGGGVIHGAKSVAAGQSGQVPQGAVW